MSTTLVLVVVLVFGVVVGRLLQRLRSRWSVPETPVYVLVGIAVGPLAGRVVSAAVLDTLQPFVSLLLGLVGFVMGLSLRRRLGEAKGLEAGVISGVWVMAAVGAASYGALYLLAPGASPWTLLWTAVAVGTLAGVSDGGAIGRLAEISGARGPVRQMLSAFSESSSMVAVLVFGLTLALARARETSVTLGLTPTEWLLAALAVGVACGVLFHLFIGRWGGDQRTFLATVAVVIFASGMAAGMGISPLLVGAVAGLTVSLISKQAGVLAQELERIEHPAMIVVLVFAGAMWVPPDGWLWVLAPVYLLVRLVAVRAGAYAAPRFVGDLPLARRLGAALVPQGGLAVAIAANFAQVFPAQGGDVLTVALVGVLVGDVLGLGAVRRVLADAGEISHVAAGSAVSDVSANSAEEAS